MCVFGYFVKLNVASLTIKLPVAPRAWSLSFLFVFLNKSGSYRGRCFGLNLTRRVPKFGSSSFGGVLLGVALYVSNAAV